MKIDNFLVDENTSIMIAMEKLDDLAKKVLYVTSFGVFVAALTDGDIRRWILTDGSLKCTIKEVANYHPVYLKSINRNEADDLMKKSGLESIPILDEKGDIEEIFFWNQDSIRTKRNSEIPVVIMAGGLGKRLYPYTKILPKPLIPIGDIPIVERIMQKFRNDGFHNFHMIINHKKNMIKAYFNDKKLDYNLTFVDEDIPLGTGGGLSLIKKEIEGTFILTNCDILINEDMLKIIDFHHKQHNTVTMICSIKNIQVPYGVININDKGEIVSMEEKPENSFLINTGVYIINDSVFNYLDNKHVDFPTVITKMISEKEKVGVFPISASSWMDMGELDKMTDMINRLDNEK